MSSYKKLVISIFFLIILSSFIYAWGPGAVYHDQNPLILSPGDSKEVTISLQNMVGGEDLRIKSDLIAGSEIATLIDKKQFYDLPFGRKDIYVKIQVSIPNDAKIGTDYTVTMVFTPVNLDSSGGLVSLVGSIEKSFPVQVREKPVVATAGVPLVPTQPTKKNSDKVVYFVLFMIVLISIAIYFVRKSIMNKTQTAAVQTQAAPQTVVQQAQPAPVQKAFAPVSSPTIEQKLDSVKKPISKSKK